jgi:exopolysaccharide biosynthesis polyprenyl glycosylphosphotransferase
MLRLPYPATIAALDSLGLFVALACSGLLGGANTGWLFAVDAGAVVAMFVLVWFAIAIHMRVYRVTPEHNLSLAVRRSLEAWAATWGVAGIVALTTVAHGFSVWFVLAAQTAFLVTIRSLVAVTPRLWAQQSIRAVVIGTHPTGGALPRSDSERGLKVVGVVPFSNEAAIEGGLRTLGNFPELHRVLANERAEVAVVSPSDAAVTGEVRSAFRTCGDLGVTVHYFPSLLDVDSERVRITWGADRPGFDIATMTSPKRALALATKRAFDLVGSSFALLLLAPVFAACAVAVKLTSEGPVFFRQGRVGAGGREFGCLKFRTMRVGAHAQQALLRSSSTQDGPAFKMPDDPRITPVGRLLRKFSLDELPQFVNVLCGEMSLVGPRPPIPSEVERYEWWQRRRVSVKPGLTCLWQVYGRNKVSFKRWVEMDIYYIDNWSLWMDLKLIAHTFHVVMRGTGM